MSKVFGYPTFDASGEMVLTTYDGDYAAMLMDVRVYKMKAGETRKFCRAGEEIAVLLLNGKMSFAWEGQEKSVSRKEVFTATWLTAGSIPFSITISAPSPTWSWGRY